MEKISNKERHLRWNCENSPDEMEMLRYHLVVVDDKNRSQAIQKIVEQFASFSPVILVRSLEGRVRNSRFRYKFVSFDSNTSPDFIDLSRAGKPVKRDSCLAERIKPGYNIESYVANLYA